MELKIDEAHTKKLLKEIMIELINDRQDLFYELIMEVIEEVGLAAAIREGRQNEFVAKAGIEAILAGQ